MQELNLARYAYFFLLAAVACGPSTSDPLGGGDGDGDGSHTGDSDAAACGSTRLQAEQALAPVDIIWVVDTSGSMDDERNEVQGALNDFSSFIEAAGIDHRVILLANPAEMSVPPPLGGSARFLHVPQNIESHDSLELLLARYADYEGFLRENSVVHVVVVTDDESNMEYGEFEAGRAALPGQKLPADYNFHSICSEATTRGIPPFTWRGPCTGGLFNGGADGIGDIYMDMVDSRGGVWRSICSTDWNPIFDALAEAATTGAALPCTFALPEPPGGQSLDPDQVNFVFTPSSGGAVTVPRVSSASACGGGAGWYYDNPSAPTQIEVCPATCDALEADTGGAVEIEFGCATIVE